MDKKLGLIALVLMVFLGTAPAFAYSDSTNQPVQVTVSDTIAITAFWANGAANSTITLGTWPADNTKLTWNGGSTGEQLATWSNVAIDVFTYAADDFQGPSGSTIGIGNFTYKDTSGTNTETAFAKGFGSKTSVHAIWAAPTQAQTNLTDPINLYLVIPWGTIPGDYNTTIYFVASKH